MGEARRRRLAVHKTNLTLVHGGKEPKPVEGPVAPVRVTDLHILAPSEMVSHINDLHAYIGHRFPTRNDFLVELLASGLAVAATALKEALAEKEARELAKAASPIETKEPKFHKSFSSEIKPEVPTDG